MPLRYAPAPQLKPMSTGVRGPAKDLGAAARTVTAKATEMVQRIEGEFIGALLEGYAPIQAIREPKLWSRRFISLREPKG